MNLVTETANTIEHEIFIIELRKEKVGKKEVILHKKN